jgi:hypothetical protein
MRPGHGLPPPPRAGLAVLRAARGCVPRNACPHLPGRRPSRGGLLCSNPPAGGPSVLAGSGPPIAPRLRASRQGVERAAFDAPPPPSAGQREIESLPTPQRRCRRRLQPPLLSTAISEIAWHATPRADLTGGTCTPPRPTGLTTPRTGNWREQKFNRGANVRAVPRSGPPPRAPGGSGRWRRRRAPRRLRAPRRATQKKRILKSRMERMLPTITRAPRMYRKSPMVALLRVPGGGSGIGPLLGSMIRVGGGRGAGRGSVECVVGSGGSRLPGVPLPGPPCYGHPRLIRPFQHHHQQQAANAKAGPHGLTRSR